MKGKELYDSLISKRDYTGSNADEYAQLLTTLFYNIDQDLFPLLESAHKDSKVLALKPEISNGAVLVDEYTINDIVLI